jgi:phosphoheptose isomerase
MSCNHGENLILLTGIPFFFLGASAPTAMHIASPLVGHYGKKQETMYALKEKVSITY